MSSATRCLAEALLLPVPVKLRGDSAKLFELTARAANSCAHKNIATCPTTLHLQRPSLPAHTSKVSSRRGLHSAACAPSPLQDSPSAGLAQSQTLEFAPPQQTATMAEAASNVPTFKLVLVGDGGTGKVGTTFICFVFSVAFAIIPTLCSSPLEHL